MTSVIFQNNWDSEATTTKEATLGEVFKKPGGASYTYVYNAGADAIAAADVVGVFSTTPALGHVSVTAATMLDSSDGTTSRSNAAGVALYAIASGSYGWIWSGGWAEHAMTTDGNIAAGTELLLADGAKVATPNTTAASAHWKPFGTASEADASTTLTGAVLENCFWDH